MSTVNVLNGLVDTETLKSSCHAPDYPSMIQVPVRYEPNANCPAVRKFLKEVLKPEDIQIIEELFGYCLYRSYPIQKAFLFVREGSNGKSTLIELLRRFLGKNNCSCLTFQEIEEDRFAREELFMKLANLSADIPSKAIHHVGLFKMLTGGDQISADRKFRDRIRFVNFAKLVFSTNRPPKVYNEDSYAFWRRWVVIDFPNQFIDNADKNLLTKLTNQEEMSGLLNLALRGLRRLLENGDFNCSNSPDEIAEHYNMLADPVLSFLSERCDLNGESTIEKDLLYQAFVEFCNERKNSLISKESFGINLRNSPTLRIGMTRLRDNGHRPYAWKGLSLKEG